MDQGRLDYYRDKLQEKRNRLEKQISSMEEDGLHQSMRDSTGELSFYDNPPGDLGNELFERAKDLALRDDGVIQLEQIELALERIEQGSYGYCTRCGKPISDERLEVMPEAEYCVACRREAEGEGNRHLRPLEEDVIRPPFGDQSVKGATYFDGEDAWQAVARYGTSETPSDLGEERARYPNVYVNWDEDLEGVEEVDAIPYLVDEEGMIARDYTEKQRG
ncbi:MAG: conjugal transfer protein TraR [Clostridia bacterium]|nr:conjugal transfer protein TraR [Clostridia bacterium]